MSFRKEEARSPLLCQHLCGRLAAWRMRLLVLWKGDGRSQQGLTCRSDRRPGILEKGAPPQRVRSGATVRPFMFRVRVLGAAPPARCCALDRVARPSHPEGT